MYKIVVSLSQLERLLEHLKAEPLTSEEAIKVLNEFKTYLTRDYHFAVEVEQQSIWRLSLKRFVPLFLTLIISLGTSYILSRFDVLIGELARYFVFAPLVSAICGNHGLQTGTITVRAMAVGTRSAILAAILKEIAIGAILGIMVGSIGGLIAALSLNEWRLVFVVGGATFTGMVTSAFMGATMPLIFSYLNIDPALIIGPAESTLQDLVSYSTYLLVLWLFFKGMT